MALSVDRLAPAPSPGACPLSGVAAVMEPMGFFPMETRR